MEHVRAYLAGVINRVESGELEDQRAARLGNLCNILVGIIQGGDLEKRLAALENAQQEKRK